MEDLKVNLNKIIREESSVNRKKTTGNEKGSNGKSKCVADLLDYGLEDIGRGKGKL